MILDKQLEFSLAQAVTTTAASDNIVDLGVARDIGVGQNLELLVRVDTAFTATTTASDTLTISLESSTSTAFGGTLVTHLTGSAVKQAALTAKTEYRFKLPKSSYQRYIRCAYTVSGTWAAGKLDACLVEGTQDNKVYTAGVTA
jgi:hypothetical protein